MKDTGRKSRSLVENYLGDSHSKDNAWKRLERKVAKDFKGKRILRGADFSISSPDGESNCFVWECKVRKNLPQWIQKSLDTLLFFANKAKKVPFFVFHEKGRRKDFVLIAYDDFLKLVQGDK